MNLWTALLRRPARPLEPDEELERRWREADRQREERLYRVLLDLARQTETHRRLEPAPIPRHGR